MRAALNSTWGIELNIEYRTIERRYLQPLEGSGTDPENDIHPINIQRYYIITG